jgi:uncharacterized protein YacL
MIIEAVRLVITLSMTAAGFLVGRAIPEWFDEASIDSDAAIVVSAVVGAGIGYVAGGLIGRLVRRGLDRAPELVGRASGPQLFAGTFGLLAGLLVGAVIAVPLLFLLPPVAGWSLSALAVLILSAFGARVFSARAGELLAAAGLRPRRPPSAERSGSAPAFVVDSSAAIDGRLLELSRSGLVTGEVWVPEFVLDELQGIADASSKNRRRRGRRGLDVLDALRDIPEIELRVIDESHPEFEEVDAKLIAVAGASGATLVTTDHNLAKAAGLRGIRVLNPHALGESLRPAMVPGDRVHLAVEREGTEPGQGVGFLDDGTMVVIEGAAGRIGDTVEVEVANAVRTTVGRMLFGRIDE